MALPLLLLLQGTAAASGDVTKTPATGSIGVAGAAPGASLSVSSLTKTPGVGSIVAAGTLVGVAFPGLTTGVVVLVGHTPSLGLNVPEEPLPPLPPVETRNGTAVFQGRDENILRDASWGGSTPATSYSFTTYSLLDPAARVLYPSGSATVIASIPSRRGDILAIPVTNADILVVTNLAGLAVSVPIPAMTRNRIPKTIVCDLSLLEPDDDLRTSTRWTFGFTCSTANLVVGAAIALYAPRRDFSFGDFQWGGTETIVTYGTSHENVYGAKYMMPGQTQRRSVSLSKLALQPDLDQINDWFDGNWGAFGPGLLWPDINENDAYLGTLGVKIDVTRLAPTSDGPVFQVGVKFDELSKGRPV